MNAPTAPIAPNYMPITVTPDGPKPSGNIFIAANTFYRKCFLLWYVILETSQKRIAVYILDLLLTPLVTFKNFNITILNSIDLFL